MEIHRLKTMLDTAGIPCVLTRSSEAMGYRLFYPAETGCACQVIQGLDTDGYDENKLEINGLLTRREQESAWWLGWLTADDVFDRISKYHHSVYIPHHKGERVSNGIDAG